MNTVELIKKYRHTLNTDYTADSRCVAAYLFTEGGTSTTVADASGHGLTGNFSSAGNPAWSTTVPKTYTPYSVGPNFSNTSYINSSYSSSLALTSNWTYCCWVLFNGQGGPSGKALFSQWHNSSDGRQIFLYVNSTSKKLQIDIPWIAGILTGATTLSVDGSTWYHIAFTKSGTTWKIYLNGNSAEGSTTDASSQEAATNQPLELGLSTPGGSGLYDLGGLLSESGIFNDALDSTEINAIMDYGLKPAAATTSFYIPRKSSYWNTKPPVGSQINFGHPLSKGLVGCWLMNEGGGPTANDLSGNKNKGILENATWCTDGIKLPSGASARVYNLNGIKNISKSTYTIVSCFRGDRDSWGTGGLYSYWDISEGDTTRGLFYGDTTLYLYNPNQSNYWDKTNNFPLRTFITTAVIAKETELSQVFLNGTIVIATSNNTPSNYTDIDSFQIGAYNVSSPNASFYFASTWKYNYIYNRALLSSEISSLYTAPYQFINKPRRTVRFVIGTTGTTVVDANANAFSIIRSRLTINAPTISATKSYAATPSLIRVSIKIQVPTASATGGYVATPALLRSRITIATPTISAGKSYAATPAIVKSSLVIKQPTIVSGGSSIATPAKISGRISILQPTISISRIATPSLIRSRITIVAPTASTSSSTAATPALLRNRLVVNSPSISYTSNRVALPSLISVRFSVFAPTVAAQGAASGINNPINLNSLIEKNIVRSSQIETAILENSAIEKTILRQSALN
jgi:hypothetical protein